MNVTSVSLYIAIWCQKHPSCAFKSVNNPAIEFWKPRVDKYLNGCKGKHKRGDKRRGRKGMPTCACTGHQGPPMATMQTTSDASTKWPAPLVCKYLTPLAVVQKRPPEICQQVREFPAKLVLCFGNNQVWHIASDNCKYCCCMGNKRFGYR